ncbi:MAG: hypothetical protein ACYDCK_12005 [Thermoplasmatota archaeon]
MNAKAFALFALCVFSMAALAGCFGRGGTKITPTDINNSIVNNSQQVKINALTSAKPLAWTFPGQQALPSKVLWINGSLDQSADTGVEDPQNRGGTSYQTLTVAKDVSAFLPPGQPAEISMRLQFDNKPGYSADLDIYVNVPGDFEHQSRDYPDEFTWTLPVKEKHVSTVGATGQKEELGVSVANGRIAPGQSLNYWMRVEFTYAKDVAAPKVPYGINVDSNVTGLIVESVKSASDAHVDATYVIIGPDDTLVQAVHFNDIDVPTQSFYVPLTKGPGMYVFYAYNETGGFLTLKADGPLDDAVARTLTVVATPLTLITDPQAAGVTEQKWVEAYAGQAQPVPYTEGKSVDFSTGTGFPLEIRPFIAASDAGVAVGDVELRVLNGKGNLVSLYHRTARWDDSKGSIGFSDDDTTENHYFDPTKLDGTKYKLSAVVDGSSSQEGVLVLSYKR